MKCQRWTFKSRNEQPTEMAPKTSQSQRPAWETIGETGSVTTAQSSGQRRRLEKAVLRGEQKAASQGLLHRECGCLLLVVENRKWKFNTSHLRCEDSNKCFDFPSVILLAPLCLLFSRPWHMQDDLTHSQYSVYVFCCSGGVVSLKPNGKATKLYHYIEAVAVDNL